MPKLLFILFNIAVAGTAFGQNWAPFTAADRYNYRHSGADRITQVLFADSSETAPDGSTRFFLNRVVADCDTCFPAAKLIDQGQFAQEIAVSQPDGRVDFRGARPFTLFPDALPGTSWLLDTAGNIQAVVTAVYAAPVLGEPDSLKQIDLSDGARIILSREHGIVSFPDWSGGGSFELTGLPARQLGEQEPDVFDIFDFQVGDVFEHSGWVTLEAGTPAMKNTVTRLTILSRSWDADTLVYLADRRSRIGYYWPPGQYIATLHDSIRIPVHPALTERWLGAYPGQLYTGPEISIISDGLAARVIARTHPDYGYIRMLGESTQHLESGCGLFYTDAIQQNSSKRYCESCFSFYRIFASGLGFVAEDRSCFEFLNYTDLTGFVKNGDTTGIISPDSFFTTGIEPEPQQIRASLLPNPATTGWQLLFPEPPAEPLAYRLYNLNGQVVEAGSIARGASEYYLAGHALPAGVYLLDLHGSRLSGRFRLVKF